MTLFLLLLGVGVGLLALELFVPGGIVGAVGLASLVGALITAYVVFGTPVGHYVLLAMLIGAGALLWWWLTIFPHSRLAGPMVSRGAIARPDHGLDHLVGARGVALTPLRPAGAAELAGERIDVVSEGGFVDAGTVVCVLRVAGTRVVVRAA